MFARSLARRNEAGPVSPQLRGQCRSFLPAIFSFLVEPRGFARRSATRGQAGDTHNVLERSDMDAQLIARTNRLGRFRALAVYVNLSTGNRLRGHRTRLKEARSPQPLINADTFAFDIARHDAPDANSAALLTVADSAR